MIEIAVLVFGVDVPFEKGRHAVDSADGIRYGYVCYDLRECSDPMCFKDMVEGVGVCDLAIMEVKDVPEAFERYDRLISALIGETAVLIHSVNQVSNDAHRNLFSGDDEYYRQLMRYLNYGLDINLSNIALVVSNHTSGTSADLPHPNRHRCDGIYVPAVRKSLISDGPAGREPPGRPCVGLMFSSLLRNDGDTAHIDAMIGELESRGLSVIPVFYSAMAFSVEGIPSPADVVERYFTMGGRPIIDALIVSSPFSLTTTSGDTGGTDNFLSRSIDVPVFHIMSSKGRNMDFSGCLEKGRVTDVRTQTALPETDGQIITYSVAERRGDGTASRLSPVADRIQALSDLIRGWISLSEKENRDKRVAILVYQSRPDKGHLANAAGLDTPASLVRLVERMISEGYSIESFPDDPDALMSMMLDGVNNAADECDENALRAMGPVMMGCEEYRREFDAIPDYNRGIMSKQWGEPPGDLLVLDGSVLVPGLVFGNLFLGFQPMRSGPDLDVDIHDASISTTHQYLAFYRWIRDVFRADAIIHFGTHGSLEWLPGKSIGMSEECYPEMVLSGIPNICPYIVNDPGEGIQARRRSCAVLISHLPPTMVRSGGYGEIEKLANSISEFRSRSRTDGYDATSVLSAIREGLLSTGIGDSLGIDPDCTDEAIRSCVTLIHEYIEDLQDALIKNGLHVLGEHPEGTDLDEFVASCIPFGLRRNPGAVEGIRGCLPAFRECGYDPGRCMDVISKRDDVDLDKSQLRELLGTVAAIKGTGGEIDSIIHALDGGYVLPSPSGSVTKGNPRIFPTGRNFYGIDPRTVPTRVSFETGRKMAGELISRYISDKGVFPGRVTVVLWATDVVKNGGEDVSMVLALMGLIPEWDDSGIVTGLRPIPISELGRPRVDVTIRITGLFRDMFGDIINLLDDGVGIVASLNETDEENRIRSDIRNDILASMSEGIPEDEARRDSTIRVFGPNIGNYGFGMDADAQGGFVRMADDYAEYGCYGYAKDVAPKKSKESFKRRVLASDILVKNMTDREIDAVDTDDVYGFLGGLMAVQRAGGKDPTAFIIDSSVADRMRIRTVQQELGFIFQSKVCNPRYIGGLMKHGYRGVLEVSKMTDNLVGWSVTGGTVEDWMYSGLVSAYLDDEAVRNWMVDKNPFAVIRIIEQLFRMVSEGLWTCDEEVSERLRGYFLEAESAVESRQG